MEGVSSIVAIPTVEIDRLFILQKRILRKIFSLGPLDSCKPLFKTNKPCLLILEAALFVNRYQNKFPRVSSLHYYPTRNNNNIIIPNFRLSAYKKDPYCFCSYVYNKLPQHIKQTNSTRKFKRSLLCYLFENSFYRIGEYL